MHNSGHMRAVSIQFVYAAIAVLVEAVGFLSRCEIVVHKIKAQKVEAAGQFRMIQLHARVYDGNNGSTTPAETLSLIELHILDRALIVHGRIAPITPTIDAIRAAVL